MVLNLILPCVPNATPKLYLPIGVFPSPSLLSFVIPFGLVISVPVQIVLKGTWSAWPVIGIIILAAAVFNIIGVLLWNAGVRAYESTGS